MPSVPPRISIARLAITSLTFMLVWVPLPVCHGTRGKWPSSLPSMTSVAACMIAVARSSSSLPRLRLTRAAAFLITAMARTTSMGMRSVPIGKFSSERWVCAPQ